MTVSMWKKVASMRNVRKSKVMLLALWWRLRKKMELFFRSALGSVWNNQQFHVLFSQSVRDCRRGRRVDGNSELEGKSICGHCGKYLAITLKFLLFVPLIFGTLLIVMVLVAWVSLSLFDTCPQWVSAPVLFWLLYFHMLQMFLLSESLVILLVVSWWGKEKKKHPSNKEAHKDTQQVDL